MGESGLDEKHLNKCGHSSCKCTVPPSSHFCSEYCARTSSADIVGTLPGQHSQEGECRCGHPDCH